MFGTPKIKVERLDNLTLVYFHSATMYKELVQYTLQDHICCLVGWFLIW